MLTGKDLIEARLKPAKWFPRALAAAGKVLAEGGSREAAIDAARACEPMPLRAPSDLSFQVNIVAENADEEANIKVCIESMPPVRETGE